MLRTEDFIAQLGRPFIAHRLRRLSETFVDGYAAWLPEAGVTAPARSLSTLLLLDAAGPLGVTEIASRLRLSHPLMIKMIAGLEQACFVALERDGVDARRRPVRLTAAGVEEVERIKAAIRILDEAYERLFEEIGIDLVDAAGRVETACRASSFHDRLRSAASDISKRKVDP